MFKVLLLLNDSCENAVLQIVLKIVKYKKQRLSQNAPLECELNLFYTLGSSSQAGKT